MPTRRFFRKPSRAVFVPAAAVAALAAATAAVPPATGAGGPCHPSEAEVTNESPSRSVHAKSGRERTDHYPSGAYRVTRCNDDGSLQIEQFVVPIAAPGGGRVHVPLTVVTPLADGGTQTLSFTPATPDHQGWAKDFQEHLPEIKRRTIPPTPES